MIAVVDYGVGNLYSLVCSLRHIGAEAEVTRDEAALRSAEKPIPLPQKVRPRAVKRNFRN